jgi:ribosomal protein L1
VDEESFNVSLRKFLKLVGVTSQREIEQAVRAALEEGRLQGSETLAVKVTLSLPTLQLEAPIEGEIKLQ